MRKILQNKQETALNKQLNSLHTRNSMQHCQNNIQALIFDLDNTLLDFFSFKRAATRAAVAAMIKHGLKVDRAKAVQALWSLYHKHGFEYRGVFQEFLNQSGRPHDLRLVSAAVIAYREARMHSLKMYPAVLSTLRALRKRGYKLYIVTDAPGLKAWLRLACVGLENEFDDVITHDDTNSSKSTGKPLQFALDKLGLKAEQVMVIGDSGSRDITPASALGAKTAIALYGRENPPLVKADYELKSIKDLLKICK